MQKLECRHIRYSVNNFLQYFWMHLDVNIFKNLNTCFRFIKLHARHIMKKRRLELFQKLPGFFSAFPPESCHSNCASIATLQIWNIIRPKLEGPPSRQFLLPSSHSHSKLSPLFRTRDPSINQKTEDVFASIAFSLASAWIVGYKACESNAESGSHIDLLFY